jgi:hypothetical protein
MSRRNSSINSFLTGAPALAFVICLGTDVHAQACPSSSDGITEVVVDHGSGTADCALGNSSISAGIVSLVDGRQRIQALKLAGTEVAIARGYDEDLRLICEAFDNSADGVLSDPVECRDVNPDGTVDRRPVVFLFSVSGSGGLVALDDFLGFI